MKFKKFLTLILMLCAIFSLIACDKKPNADTDSTTENETVESESKTENETVESESTNNGGSGSITFIPDPNEDPAIKKYYENVDNNLRGEALITNLSHEIARDFNKIPYGTHTTNKELLKTDANPNNPGELICFYSGESYRLNEAEANTHGWNKEHVWAKSHGFPKGSGGNCEHYNAYGDLHHLRPTNKNINSMRSNLDFDNVANHPNKSARDAGFGNKYIPNVCFEPRDEVKGDIARIMFYMATRYHNGIGGNGLNLTISETIPTSQSKGDGRLGRLSTLLEWNVLDPVDDFERNRNNVIYSIQKNRNPFIDRPDYADLCFNENADVDLLDMKKVYKVNEKIAGLPDLDVLTLQAEDYVMSCKKLYDELSLQEKAKVKDVQKLNDAIKKINELKNPNGGGTPENPDIPVTGNVIFKTNLVNSDLGDIKYTDKNHNFTSDGRNFFLSQGYRTNNTFRIGSNKTANPLDSKYGINQNGVVLEMGFELYHVSGLKIDIDKTYGSGKYLILFKEEGTNNYVTLKEGEITETMREIEAGLETSKNGHFALVLLGNSPRLDLTNFTVYRKNN